jgi:hypothetical protein
MRKFHIAVSWEITSCLFLGDEHLQTDRMYEYSTSILGIFFYEVSIRLPVYTASHLKLLKREYWPFWKFPSHVTYNYYRCLKKHSILTCKPWILVTEIVLLVLLLLLLWLFRLWNYRPLTCHLTPQSTISLIFSSGFVRICGLITLIKSIYLLCFKYVRNLEHYTAEKWHTFRGKQNYISH